MRESGLMAKRYLTVFIVTLGCCALVAMTRTQLPTPTAFPSNTTRHALVSLLSVEGPQAWWSQQKYVAAAEKLAKSFRKHSTMDMVLLVVDEFGALRKKEERRLGASGWTVHRMRKGIMPQYSRGEWNRYFTAKLFSKLWIWRLALYEQILYTDLDTLFIHSPEQLFHMRTSSQNPGMVLDPTKKHYYNAGVILLRPSEDEYQRLISAMDSYEHHGETAEQDFLNIFYHGRIVQLDPRFNRQVCAEETKGCINDRSIGPVKSFAESDTAAGTVILHFTGSNKPWHMENCVKESITMLCLFWKHYGY
jgi:lipopolysaccharide biosynthesis glycosyltransferase